MKKQSPEASEINYQEIDNIMGSICEENSLDLVHRPRRLRETANMRALVEENSLRPSDFIYPLFVIEGENTKEEIKSMPGIHRFSIDALIDELKEVVDLGIRGVALFPVVDESKKTDLAEESFNPNALMQRAIREIKEIFPELLVVSDVALDPYTSHGHDGILGESSWNPPGARVLNDETVAILSQMAIEQANAGADIVAPSDMMDGRVIAIREALDDHGFADVSIMAYSAKYASAFYGPFRDALGSLGSAQTAEQVNIPKDKKSYQLNPANSREAMRELELDLDEGADFVMVKPAGFYLDIIAKFKEHSNVPVVAYQVSGEYAMIKNAAENGLVDLDKAIYESLISIKRAGADIILSYFAKSICKELNS